MKLLHHLSFVLLCTTNDDEMKKNEFDFPKMKFHLHNNYVEWACIMQVELNAIQWNLNSIKISKIEFKYIEWNSNFIELNQAQYSFSLDSTRLMFPLNSHRYKWVVCKCKIKPKIHAWTHNVDQVGVSWCSLHFASICVKWIQMSTVC